MVLLGDLSEERLGLLCAGHSQFQSAPMDALLGKDGGISVKVYLIQGKKCWIGRGGGVGRAKSKKQQVREERKE